MTIYAKLRKIAELIDINDLKQARKELTKFPKKQQQNPAFRQAYGRLLQKEGKPEKAIKYLKDIVKEQDTNFEALNTLGLAYMATNDFELARENIEKCIELKPNYAYGYCNLGIIAFHLNNFDEAITYCEKALAHDEDLYQAKNCIGMCHYKQGNFEEAKKVLFDSISAFEANPQGYIYLLNVLFSEQNHDDVKYYSDRALRIPHLNNMDIIEILTLELISTWLLSQYQSIKPLMAKLSQLIRDEKSNEFMLKDKKGFFQSIFHANDFHEKYPDLYTDDESLEKLYFICESHCLPSNNLKITYDNTDYRINSKFVRGCKIFHLSSDVSNSFKQSIIALSETLPDDINVITGFGEIDCRTDEGLFKVAMSKNINIEENIDTIVPKYLNFITEVFKDKAKKLFIYGVPSPNPVVLENLDESDKLKFTNMIAYMNDKLRTEATERGYAFLDVYAETNQDGISNMKYHYDNHHVTPAIIPVLFDNIKN